MVASRRGFLKKMSHRYKFSDLENLLIEYHHENTVIIRLTSLGAHQGSGPEITLKSNLAISKTCKITF